MRILIILLLLLPGAARGAGPCPYYFIAVQNGSYNFAGGEAQLEESYKALQGMVKLANAQNVRLTLLFSPQYAFYIASAPVRLEELNGWKKNGHEIGAYHQGPASRAWDGYSDLPAKDLAAIRKEKPGGRPVPGHQEYFAALDGLEPDLKAGCMEDRTDKKFLTASPVYEICGGLSRNIAVESEKPGAGGRGISEFIAVSGGAQSVKKTLACFHPADKAGIEAAKLSFSGLSDGAYGASFKSSPNEFGAFYSWLSFLRSIDPEGLRSRTVSALAAGKILTERQAAAIKPLKKKKKQSLKPEPEVSTQDVTRQDVPRLKPVRSFYGKVGKMIFGPPNRQRKPDKTGYCGDGICDAFERAYAGRCPRDCGQ